MPRKQTRPPIKLRKKFMPLIELCRDRILTAPSQTSGTSVGDALISIVITWPVRKGARNYLVADLPDGFPGGTVLSKGADKVVMRHDCVKVLAWAKDKGYINYDAATLFRGRLPALMMLAKAELKLDRLIEGLTPSLDVDDGQQT